MRSVLGFLKKIWEHVCWIKAACAALRSCCADTQTVASYIRSAVVCASSAHISGWFMLPHCGGLDRWPLWEREERVCPPLSFSLPTPSVMKRSLHYKHFSTTAVRVCPSIPLSTHKRIKELRFYVRSQDNWKWWLNLWWPLCVENASLLSLYTVVSYRALASYLSGTETFKSLSVWRTVYQARIEGTSHVCLN